MYSWSSVRCDEIGAILFRLFHRKFQKQGFKYSAALTISFNQRIKQESSVYYGESDVCCKQKATLIPCKYNNFACA